MDVFVGRDQELAALRRQRDVAASGVPQVAVVSAEPGMGRTSLLRRFSAELGPSAVSAQPTGPVRPFSFLNEILASLPAPGGRPPEGLPVSADPWGAGSRLIEALNAAQRHGPVTIVADDLHRADRQSLVALTFAGRRLVADKVQIVVSVTNRSPAEVALAPPRPGARLDLRLTGLREQDLVRLGAALGVSLTRPAAHLLHETTVGAPLHAALVLEECRSQGSWAPPAAVLRLCLAEVIRARLARCGPETLSLLRTIAVTGPAPCRVVAAVARVPHLEARVEEARRARLVAVVGPYPYQVVGVAHPLVASLVLDGTSRAERNLLHTRAAEAADTELGALEHRRAVVGEDLGLSAEYAALGHRMARRGLWRPAAEALRGAAEVAGPGDPGDRWWWEGIESLLRSGEVGEAAAVSATRDTAPSLLREYVLGRISLFAGRMRDAEERLTRVCEQAQAREDVALAGRAAGDLAHAKIMQGRAAEAAHWARLSTRMPPALEWPGTATVGLLGMALGIAGRYREAFAVVDAAGPPGDAVADGELRCTRGALRLFTDDLTEARRELLGMLQSSQEGGQVFWTVTALGVLTDVEYRSGNWNTSAGYGELAVSMARDTDQVWLYAWVHACAAAVPTQRGLWVQAEEHVRAARATAATAGGVAYAAAAAMALARARGDPAGVVQAAAPIRALDRPDGAYEHGIIPWRDLYIEALIDLGHREQAEGELHAFERSVAERSGRSGPAAASRVRGRLEASRGHPRQAREAYRQALHLTEALAMPFQRAMTALEVGEYLLRHGDRTQAVPLLDEALTVLAGLGAEPFAQRARGVLDAAGCRRSFRADELPTVLTPQEMLISTLVAQGQGNREIARTLVVSEKTVEFHLSRIYAQVGVRSRLQLARLLLAEHSSAG